jgi:hypothetical protein
MPMRAVRSFRDLIVWQRSVELTVAVYALTRGSNFEVQTQLILSRRLKFGGDDGLCVCEGLSAEVEKMLVAFAATLGRGSEKRLI